MQTKVRKEYKLGEFSFEGALSRDGKHLWIGEYRNGVVHQYDLDGVNAVQSTTFNIQEEAVRMLGPKPPEQQQDFRIVAVSPDDKTLFFHSGTYDAILVLDRTPQRASATIPLPIANNSARFVQSPDGNRLMGFGADLLLIDLPTQAIIARRESLAHALSGDFNRDGTRFYVAYSAPAMLPIPFMHRGGQIDEFDMQCRLLKTWHSDASRIGHLGMSQPIPWMVADHGDLQLIRLP